MATQADIERIWARMPAEDQNRVLAAPELYRWQLIELWEAADYNERHPSRYMRETDREAEAEAVKQDALDEQLLERASNGEYGAAALEAVRDCKAQFVVGTTRRSFLRAVRVAIEKRRHGSDWVPGRKSKRASPEQAALPLGATGAEQRDPRFP